MTIFGILIVLAFVATLTVLATGIGSMAHGGKFDRKHDVQLMGARVALQGVTVALILLAIYVAGH